MEPISIREKLPEHIYSYKRRPCPYDSIERHYAGCAYPSFVYSIFQDCYNWGWPVDVIKRGIKMTLYAT